MANRRFNQFHYSLESSPVTLYMKVSFGSTGAPTLVSGANQGIASIVRASAGKYTITLQDSYKRVLDVNHVFENATAPAAPGMYIFSETVNTTTSPNLVVIFNSAGTATDPGSGEVVLMSIVLKNSSVL